MGINNKTCSISDKERIDIDNKELERMKIIIKPINR